MFTNPKVNCFIYFIYPVTNVALFWSIPSFRIIYNNVQLLEDHWPLFMLLWKPSTVLLIMTLTSSLVYISFLVQFVHKLKLISRMNSQEYAKWILQNTPEVTQQNESFNTVLKPLDWTYKYDISLVLLNFFFKKYTKIKDFFGRLIY